jgi:hypothetical protein
LASSEFISVASILVPSEISPALLPALAEVEEADEEVAEVVDLEASVEFLPALAEADEDVDLETSAEFLPASAEAAVDADPLLEACAPDLLVCTEVCDCVEAPACADVDVCADTIPAPIIPTISIGRIRFTVKPLLWAESTPSTSCCSLRMCK